MYRILTLVALAVTLALGACAATYNGGYPGMANMDPHARIGFSAQGSFKRSDFGMSFGLPPAGTTMGLGDSINLMIEAEFSGPPLSVPGDASH